MCNYCGYSRQWYYKKSKYIEKKNKEIEIVVETVKEERKVQPRLGTRKLQKKVNLLLKNRGIKVSRDNLFDALRERGLLIKMKKSCRTTNSMHKFRKYKNLIKNMEITKPNQVWVSDITYISTLGGFCYLCLITDLYSRKILGYDVSNSLSIEGSLRALKMALKHKKESDNVIHHSDRGIQYCSNGYVEELRKNNIEISMTEEQHVYENSVAERVNGILKSEFMLGGVFRNQYMAEKNVINAVKIYNQERYHFSLGLKTPDEVYYEKEEFLDNVCSEKQLAMV